LCSIDQAIIFNYCQLNIFPLVIHSFITMNKYLAIFLFMYVIACCLHEYGSSKYITGGAANDLIENNLYGTYHR
jgi:general stress protein CsbA